VRDSPLSNPDTLKDTVNVVPAVKGFVKGMVAVPGGYAGCTVKALISPHQVPFAESTIAVDEVPGVKAVGPYVPSAEIPPPLTPPKV
jgi:hypothetical protein